MLTLAFVPNLMRLALREGDRRPDALMAGAPAAYAGDAAAPASLSWFERCARGPPSRSRAPCVTATGARTDHPTAAASQRAARHAAWNPRVPAVTALCPRTCRAAHPAAHRPCTAVRGACDPAECDGSPAPHTCAAL